MTGIEESTAFVALAEKVRRWVCDQHWADFTDVQTRTIPLLRASQNDVLVCAPTASGKTEAAFLPILSDQIDEPAGGVFALYVSPLKALIDDVRTRLSPLTSQLGIPFHRRHGDVPTSERAVFDLRPRGILAITPESLEGLLMARLTTPFRELRVIVVDELHSFIGSERGVQLRCQMARLDTLVGRSIRRIGLSATIADPSQAADYLRPGGHVVKVCAGARAFRVGALKSTPNLFDEPAVSEASLPDVLMGVQSFVGEQADEWVARLLFDTLRGGDHLVFDGSRAGVERTCDLLAQMSEAEGTPSQFVPHHGSLSKGVRREAEGRIRGKTPTTIVCTSTLELGIDIGTVESVVQIGPPPSVSSLRQRLGRSGRRDLPPELRIVFAWDLLDQPERLYRSFLQTIASAELMLEGWCEPAWDDAPHYSTLTQQILSMLKERGALCLTEFEAIVGSANLAKANLNDLIEALCERDLVDLRADRKLVLGLSGISLTADPGFVVAFATYDDYRVFADGRHLGNVPAMKPPEPGEPMLLAGRRWRVVESDPRTKVIHVAPGSAVELPQFTGESPRVHREVRRKMKHITESSDVPAYLDDASRALLGEVRNYFRNQPGPVVPEQSGSVLHHWSGDREAFTLAAMLDRQMGTVWSDWGALASLESPRQFRERLMSLLSGPIPTAEELAQANPSKARHKWDWLLPDDLLVHEIVCREIDVPGALAIAEEAIRTP